MTASDCLIPIPSHTQAGRVQTLGLLSGNGLGDSGINLSTVKMASTMRDSDRLQG